MKSYHHPLATQYGLILSLALLIAPSTSPANPFFCAGFATDENADRISPRTAKLAQSHTEGTRRALVLFAQFRDEEPGWGQIPAWSEEIFDPGKPGSFSHFYDAMSFGKLQVRGEVAPQIYASARATSTYLASNSVDYGDYGRFSLEILRQADRDIDFSLYDSDGPDGLPNSGDDDGSVDALFVIAPSTPQNFLLGGATGMGDLGFEEPYITDDLGVSGVPIRILPELSAIQRGRTFAEAAGSMCHEYGHILGLPDLYNVEFLQRENARPEEDSAGIGSWGLMGWGASGWHGDDGPNSFCAWSRVKLGWSKLEEIERISQEIRLEDVGLGGPIFKLPLTGQEFFLLEYRTRAGNYYDRHIPGEGLLIWHVEWLPPAEDRFPRTLVDLECADGRWKDSGYPLGETPDSQAGEDNLDFWAHDPDYTQRHSGNLGDGTDPFDGVRFRAFTLETNPASYSSDGSRSVRIENIRIEEDLAIADVQVDHPLVQVEEIRIVDASEDGVLVAGEEGYIRFYLINRGGLPARAVRAVLSAADPLAEILHATVHPPDLNIDEGVSEPSAEGADVLRFRLDPNFAGVRTATLWIDVYTGEGWAGRGEFTLTAAGLRQEVREITVVDSSGNRDGTLQPGEFFHLVLSLAEGDLETLATLHFSLHPLDPRVRKTSDLSVFFGAAEEGRVRSVVSPEFLLETEVEESTELGFELKVDNRFGTWKDTLYARVGAGEDRTSPRITRVQTRVEKEGVIIHLSDTWILDGSPIRTVRAFIYATGDTSHLAAIPLERQEDGFEGIWKTPPPGVYWLAAEVEDAADNRGRSSLLGVTILPDKEESPDIPSPAQLELPPDPCEATVTHIAVASANSNIWYAATYTGLWRSEDRGETWNRTGMMFNGLDLPWSYDTSQQRLAIHISRNPLTLYVIEFGELLRSRDGGVRWERIPPPFGDPGASFLGLDPEIPGRIYAQRGRNLLISEDEGSTWSETRLDSLLRTPMTHPADPQSLFTGRWAIEEDGVKRPGRLWHSADGGATWDSHPLDRVFADIRPDPRSTAALYGRVEFDLWHSPDTGRTWRQMEVGASERIYQFHAHPQRPGLIYVRGLEHFLRTLDGGATWKQLLAPLRSVELMILPTKELQWAFFTGFTEQFERPLFWSRDYGEHYEPITWSEESRLAGGMVFAPDGQLYIGSMEDGDFISKTPRILTSPDRGITWEQLSAESFSFAPSFFDVIYIDPQRPEIAIAHQNRAKGQYGPRTAVYARSVDAGKTWKAMTRPTGERSNGWGLPKILSDPHRKGVHYIANRRVWRTADFGETWELQGLEADPLAFFPLGGLTLDPDDTSHLYASQDDTIWRSTDSGQSWETVGRIAPGERLFALEFHPGRGSRLYALTGGEFHLSEDKGRTWSLLWKTGTRPWLSWTNSHLRFDPHSPERIYLVNSRQLYQSEDAGHSWKEIGTDIGGYPWFNDLAIDPFDPSLLYISTTWGIYLLDRDGEAVSAIENIQQLPTTFSLHQNYPNPFNAQTIIPYQLPQAGKVQLVIYDIAGQKVRTLMDKTQPTGPYRIVWNGRDDADRAVASGVFFYRLSTEDQVQTRRMLLLK